MNISHIDIRLTPGKNRLLAVASMTLDGKLIVNDIKLLTNGKKMFAVFPVSTNKVQSSVLPASRAAQLEFESALFAAYHAEKQKQAM